MVAVAGYAGRPAPAKGFAVQAGQIVFQHTDMTAAAKSRDSRLFRHAEETAGRAHGIGRILGVAAMTGVAGNAVFGMNAPLPEFDRFTVLARQLAVTLDADDLVCSGSRSQDLESAT